MKVVVVSGSPRSGGNTAKFARLFAEELGKAASASAGQPRCAETCELELVDLARRRVEPCLGCRLCFDRGEAACPRKDDLLPIYVAISSADALVLASPVYVDDASGLMKHWIDRMAWLCHRPALRGKLSFILSTAGAANSPRAVGTMAMATRLWGCTGVGSSSIVAGGTLAAGDEERYRPAAAKAARRLFIAYQRGAAKKPRFLPMLVDRVQRLYWKRFADDSFDCAWWAARDEAAAPAAGGTGSSPGRRASAPLRRVLAWALGGLVAALIFPPPRVGRRRGT